METVALAPDVISTRVGFGCAGLMRESSGRDRRRVLAAAFDEGIRHFDVARMYGLGAAEGELGRFARGRRDDLVIATKFGIEATSAPGRLARIQGPARKLIARYPRIREHIKRHSSAFHQPHRYDADAARSSLETSLRELGTDYVDVLFLHDPAPGDVVDLPEIGGYLEEAREKGYLRAWGVAGEPDPCVRLRQSMPKETILQVRDDIFSHPPGLADVLQPAITFGVLSGALERVAAHMSESPGPRKRWSETLNADCSSPQTIASLLMQDGLRANSRGVVLLSTTRPERLSGLDSLVSASRDDSINLGGFRHLVNDELARA
jgi:hypothetical protein